MLRAMFKPAFLLVATDTNGSGRSATSASPAARAVAASLWFETKFTVASLTPLFSRMY